MLANNKAKALWIYGKHPISSILKNNKRKILQLVVSDKKLFEEFKILLKGKIPIRLESDKYLKSLFPNSFNLQNAAIEVEYLKQPTLEELVINNSPNCLVLLDHITDSQNVGAIIRSTAAFNAGAVITTYDNSPEENSGLLKSACGAFETVPYIRIVNLRNCINLLKDYGYWCIGLDAHTNQFMCKTTLPQKIAFIMGAEDSGLRKLTKQTCDILLRLKISDKIESLNVSNALAISLYEYNRQWK